MQFLAVSAFLLLPNSSGRGISPIRLQTQKMSVYTPRKVYPCVPPRKIVCLHEVYTIDFNANKRGLLLKATNPLQVASLYFLLPETTHPPSCPDKSVLCRRHRFSE